MTVYCTSSTNLHLACYKSLAPIAAVIVDGHIFGYVSPLSLVITTGGYLATTIPQTISGPELYDLVSAKMDAVTVVDHHHTPSSPQEPDDGQHAATDGGVQHDDLETAKQSVIVTDSTLTGGTARAEAMQLVWGRHGRLIVWLGISMMLIV